MENPTAGWSQSVHATLSNPRQSILEPFLSLFPKWIGRLSQEDRLQFTIFQERVVPEGYISRHMNRKLFATAVGTHVQRGE